MNNIKSIIGDNPFFNRFISDDMLETVLIGNIELNLSGSITVNVHTREKPLIEVPKYGVWGRDYDIIVIELWAVLGTDFHFKNRDEMGFSSIKIIDKSDNNHTIQQIKGKGEICFEIKDDFLFRGTSTYIE